MEYNITDKIFFSLVTEHSLNSVSAQVQILLTVFRRFAIARISDNGFNWISSFTPFVSQPFHKMIHHHCHTVSVLSPLTFHLKCAYLV